MKCKQLHPESEQELLIPFPTITVIQKCASQFDDWILWQTCGYVALYTKRIMCCDAYFPSLWLKLSVVHSTEVLLFPFTSHIDKFCQWLVIIPIFGQLPIYIHSNWTWAPYKWYCFRNDWTLSSGNSNLAFLPLSATSNIKINYLRLPYLLIYL